MTIRIKAHLAELGWFIASAGGAITAYQEQIDWWLRCSASLVAITAGFFTIYSFIGNRRKNAQAAKAITALLQSGTLDAAGEQKLRGLLTKFELNKTITPDDLQ